MVIMLSIQGITYVKCAESCSSKVWTSDKPTYRVALWELRQRFQRFAGFTIAKQPTFPRNKFGMSETSCTIGLSSKFVKFHLVQGGNRQEITRNNNVVQGGKISLIRRSKTRQKESTVRMRRRFSALSIPPIPPKRFARSFPGTRFCCLSFSGGKFSPSSLMSNLCPGKQFS